MERQSFRVRIDNGAQGAESRFLGCLRPTEGLRAIPAPMAYCYDDVGDALAASEGEAGRRARVANVGGDTFYGYVIERVPEHGENPCRTQPMLTVPMQIDPTARRRALVIESKAQAGECGHERCERPGAGAAGNCSWHDALATMVETAYALVAQTRGQGYPATDELEAAIAAFETEDRS